MKNEKYYLLIQEIALKGDFLNMHLVEAVSSKWNQIRRELIEMSRIVERARELPILNSTR